MGGSRTYTDQQLLDALDAETSWRGVLRHLGLAATSASAIRSVRRRAEDLGLAHAHLRGQRGWCDEELIRAVAESEGWDGVAARLGLRGGSYRVTLKGHAARLGLSVEHLASPVGPRPDTAHQLDPSRLRVAGSLMAAGWLTLAGYDVSWPLEPCVYDLLAVRDRRVNRIQVKTSTVRSGATWAVRITRSGRGGTPYDPDDLDYFFVIDGDLDFYLIPVAEVGGLSLIHSGAYQRFRVPRTLSGQRKSRED